MEISSLGTEKIRGKLMQISFQGTGKIPTIFHLMEAKTYFCQNFMLVTTYVNVKNFCRDQEIDGKV